MYIYVCVIMNKQCERLSVMNHIYIYMYMYMYICIHRYIHTHQYTHNDTHMHACINNLGVRERKKELSLSIACEAENARDSAYTLVDM